MHLKLQPSQVLYFLKERSLCYDLIPYCFLVAGVGGKVTQHRECGEQAGFGTRTVPKDEQPIPWHWWEMGRRTAVSGNKDC